MKEIKSRQIIRRARERWKNNGLCDNNEHVDENCEFYDDSKDSEDIVIVSRR